MAATNEHPERFDPARSGGTLMDAEHRCRYLWAAQAAKGKDVLDAACGTGYGALILAEADAASVTGIDISGEAVDAARDALGDNGTVVRGNIAELPFDDDSFDLAVCLETIEHVADGAAAVAELRRVLRPDGVLLISSPNPGVSQGGNEHHVHEYAPAELTDLVRASFARAVEHMQHPWIASTIRPVDATRTPAPDADVDGEVGAGEQTDTLIAAGDGEVPDLDALLTLSGTFELGWWSEQLEHERAGLDRAAEIENRLTRELAATYEREKEAGKRLAEANGRAVQLSEEIGRLRVMEQYFGKLKGRNEELETHYEVAVTRLREIEGSKAWRLIEKLRRLRARLR